MYICPLNGRSQSLGNFFPGLQVCFCQENCELFTADARRRVYSARSGLQDFREPAQYLITHVMSITVIDRLEVIDVENQQAEWAAVATRAIDLPLHLPFKPASVSESGEVIGKCGFFAGVQVVFEVQQGTRACQQQ